MQFLLLTFFCYTEVPALLIMTPDSILLQQAIDKSTIWIKEDIADKGYVLF